MSSLLYIVGSFFFATIAVLMGFMGMRSTTAVKSSTKDNEEHNVPPIVAVAEIPSSQYQHQPPPITPSMPSITLPSGATPYLSDAIFPGSSFTWDEATHGGTRIPENAQVEANIMKLARRIQPYRDVFGDREWIVTSWYRPSDVNEAIPGAVTNSMHLTGLGMDFIVEGMTSMEIAETLRTSVRPGGWEGGLGVYPRLGHVHLDVGTNRSWQR